MEHISKKVKVEELRPSSEPFTQEGVYEDEITLEFEEKKLYVSKNFLCIASPVFEGELKKKKQNHVKMTGKSYEDCLEFLLSIHPRIQKGVDEKNVLRIAPLAEKYEVTAIVSKCKTAMQSVLSKAQDTIKEGDLKVKHLKPLRECLTVLKSAISLNYTDISDLSVNAIARFGYSLYNDSIQWQHDGRIGVHGYTLESKIGSHLFLTNKIRSDHNEETYSDVRKECTSSFQSLPFEWRNKILSRRLENINDDNFK